MERDQDQPDEPAQVDEPFDADADASEADVLDQHRGAAPRDSEDELGEIPADVPEADALDQARSVPLDDDRET